MWLCNGLYQQMTVPALSPQQIIVTNMRMSTRTNLMSSSIN